MAWVGDYVLDLNIYLIGVIVVLILAFLGLIEKDVEWAVFPGIGAVIGTYLTLSVYADGSLTELSGSTSVAIVSASTTATSAWQFVSLIPMMFTFASALFAVYKIGKSF